MPEIIFDACVLSNFAFSDSLAILKTLYPDSVFTADMVLLENLRGIRKGHEQLVRIRSAVADGWLRELSCSTPEEKRFFEALSLSLGVGESACIAIAGQRNFVFACDDRAARKEATLCGVMLTGTIGILIKAVRVGEIELRKANSILKKLVEYGFYAPVERVTREMVHL